MAVVAPSENSGNRSQASSRTGSDRKLFDPEDDPYIRDLNFPVISMSAFMNILCGTTLIGLETAGLIIAGVNGTHFLFAGASPGIFEGIYFITWAVLGITIRRCDGLKQLVPHQMVVGYVVMSVVGSILNIVTIFYIAYVLTADGETLQLCFGPRTSCMFDIRLHAALTCEGQDCVRVDVDLHDLFATLLFCMILCHIFIFMFGFAAVLVTVRWREFCCASVLPKVGFPRNTDPARPVCLKKDRDSGTQRRF